MADTQMIPDQLECTQCSGTLKTEEGKDCSSCSKRRGSSSSISAIKIGPAAGVKPQVNGASDGGEKSEAEECQDGSESEDGKVVKQPIATKGEAATQADQKEAARLQKKKDDSLGEPQAADTEEAQNDLKENGVSEEVQEEKEEREDLGPDDVVCDSCIDSPRRASRSCLTCLVSYCEGHLRPHLENAKFQNHRLVEPLRDIERRTCESHKWPLELYCCADACCLCQDCATQEHRGHNTMPILDARRKIEKELNDKQTEMVKTVTAAENAINKLQVNTVSIETSVKEVRSVMEEQFSALQAAVERAQQEMTEMLEAEEKQALRQAEGIRVHLEQRCVDLKKTQAQVEKISRYTNDVDFLQEYSEWRKESPDIIIPSVSIGLTDRLNAFSRVIVSSTQELCDKLLTTYLDTLKETWKNDKVSIKNTVQAIVAAKQNGTIPDPKIRTDFLKYSTPLSFDASTVHKFLRLTEDNHKVTNTTPWQHSYDDVPERFEHWRQVLTTESFYMGRHYFEVDVSGEGTHVGLTYKSIERKAEDVSGCITGNGFSWCLCWDGRGFSGWHCDVETQLDVGKFTRIGVYVDYHGGRLAFYGVEQDMVLLHEYRAEFLEPLYPAFWLSKKENVVLLVPPGDALPLKSPSPPSTPPTLQKPPPPAAQ